MLKLAGRETAVADEEWMTVSEIAERLKVTEQTIRRWLRARRLRGRNFGGKAGYRVAKRDLDEFLHRGEERREQP